MLERRGGIRLQPTIICTSPVPGMLYLNGRFAGEVSRQCPLCAPVSPWGPAYLEYRPLAGPWAGIARRCVFSGGAPLADSLAEADGLYGVAWPGGALELEFRPFGESREDFALEGIPCAMLRGEETALALNGLEIPLPEGAEPPRLLRLPGAAALLGDIEGGGQYLAALAGDMSAAFGTIEAERIEPAGGGLFTAIVALGDRVGHGRLEQWLVDGNGLNRASSESVWASGAPRWPQTAEEAMIAAVEAALAGLHAEAEGYMTPALAAGQPLREVGAICDVCAPMKYGAPGPLPGVALLRAENGHLATARPLYYRAEEGGGAQGPWRITRIELSGN